MKTILLYLTVLGALVLPLTVRAASLDEANAAFASGKFAESTAGFESVLQANGYSAPVLYDLGNSYVRAGDYPRAILAYKRALWLAPNDEDIKANLETAQKQAGVAVEKSPGYMAIAGVLSVNGWAWLACAMWTLLCVCLLARVVWPGRGGLLVTGAVLSGFVLVDAIVAIGLSSGPMSAAVVVDKNPQALVSPFPGATAQEGFSPAPGATVKIVKAYNDFVFVSDSGHVGWMPKGQLEPVVR